MGLARDVWYKQEWGFRLGESKSESVQGIKVHIVMKLQPKLPGRLLWELSLRLVHLSKYFLKFMGGW